jgi:hypothetical protein
MLLRLDQLEQERAQIERKEEKRRHCIEEHLAQEQQALAKVQTKAYHAMTWNQSPRESPIADRRRASAGEVVFSSKNVITSGTLALPDGGVCFCNLYSDMDTIVSRRKATNSAFAGEVKYS